MPALFTRISIEPAAAAVAIIASTAARSVTSTLTAVARPPAAVMLSAVSRALSPRAAAITCAPRAASIDAIARPMPRDAPVTMALRPSRSPGTRLHLQFLDESRAGKPGRHENGAPHRLSRGPAVSYHC